MPCSLLERKKPSQTLKMCLTKCSYLEYSVSLRCVNLKEIHLVRQYRVTFGSEVEPQMMQFELYSYNQKHMPRSCLMIGQRNRSEHRMPGWPSSSSCQQRLPTCVQVRYAAFFSDTPIHKSSGHPDGKESA